MAPTSEWSVSKLYNYAQFFAFGGCILPLLAYESYTLGRSYKHKPSRRMLFGIILYHICILISLLFVGLLTFSSNEAWRRDRWAKAFIFTRNSFRLFITKTYLTFTQVVENRAGIYNILDITREEIRLIVIEPEKVLQSLFVNFIRRTSTSTQNLRLFRIRGAQTTLLDVSKSRGLCSTLRETWKLFLEDFAQLIRQDFYGSTHYASTRTTIWSGAVKFH